MNRGVIRVLDAVIGGAHTPPEICQATGMHRVTVFHTLYALEASKLLKIDGRAGRSYRYVLHPRLQQVKPQA